MARTKIVESADTAVIETWRAAWEAIVLECWRAWEGKGKKDTTGFMTYLVDNRGPNYRYYWIKRKKVMYGDITVKDFFTKLGLPIGPRKKPYVWPIEKRCETVYAVLDEQRPNLKKALEKTSFENQKSVRKLEDWIINERIRIPTKKFFPESLTHDYGHHRICEETCGRAETIDNKQNEWYIPFLHKESDYYAPWVLFEEIEWEKEGENLKVKAIKWIVEWRMAEIPWEPTRAEICSLDFKTGFDENALSGLRHKYDHPYDALVEAGYDQEPWNIKLVEMKKMSSGGWDDERNRKDNFVRVTKERGIFPADIGDTIRPLRRTNIREILRKHMDNDLTMAKKEWRKALKEAKLLSKENTCPKCGKLSYPKRRGVFKCGKCDHIFEVYKEED